jgi:hypothetical protein
MPRRRRSSVVLSFSSLREPQRGEMNENGAFYQTGGGGGGVFNGVPLLYYPFLLSENLSEVR